MMDEGKKILLEISDSLRDLATGLDDNFVKAVELIYNCRGKVIITGLGKSGLIGKKIAATFASTGTPSFFIHSTEALHGDIGMINNEDIVIAISNSGSTAEVVNLIPFLKRKGIKVISITKNEISELAKLSDVMLRIDHKKEAGELGLAPTTSTTLTLSMGDALAMCLLKKRNLRPEEFALLHPGGSLGKKLSLRVEDIMHKEKENPLINENSLVRDAILEISSRRMGAVNVIDSEGILVGIITDGDLRRLLPKLDENIFNKKVFEIMTKNPIHIHKDKLGTEALHVMEDRESQIPVLPVVDNHKRAIGIIRIHDLVRAGIN
ncbi:MAG: KpsF/GutQ family sugar-phosphate isomerase [Candidatus Pacearchaeota archaeon]|jgi:arabinose-5-phosphate isomerase